MANFAPRLLSYVRLTDPFLAVPRSALLAMLDLQIQELWEGDQ